MKNGLGVIQINPSKPSDVAVEKFRFSKKQKHKLGKGNRARKFYKRVKSGNDIDIKRAVEKYDVPAGTSHEQLIKALKKVIKKRIARGGVAKRNPYNMAEFYDAPYDYQQAMGSGLKFHKKVASDDDSSDREYGGAAGQFGGYARPHGNGYCSPFGGYGSPYGGYGKRCGGRFAEKKNRPPYGMVKY
jgi:hypothetical protein